MKHRQKIDPSGHFQGHLCQRQLLTPLCPGLETSPEFTTPLLLLHNETSIQRLHYLCQEGEGYRERDPARAVLTEMKTCHLQSIFRA